MAKKVTGNMMNAVASPPKDLENDYEAQNHLDTLVKAHGIINDPDKMKKVHALAGRHHKAIQGIKTLPGPSAPKAIKSIQDLRDAGNALSKKRGQPKASLGALVDGQAPDDEQD